jgi:hypothetical protein
MVAGAGRDGRHRRPSIPLSVGSPNGERRPEPRRVGTVVRYPPLCEMSAEQRQEFHEALLDADGCEDLPGTWQAAILKAEQNRPDLRLVQDA